MSFTGLERPPYTPTPGTDTEKTIPIGPYEEEKPATPNAGAKKERLPSLTERKRIIGDYPENILEQMSVPAGQGLRDLGVTAYKTEWVGLDKQFSTDLNADANNRDIFFHVGDPNDRGRQLSPREQQVIGSVLSELDFSIKLDSRGNFKIRENDRFLNELPQALWRAQDMIDSWEQVDRQQKDMKDLAGARQYLNTTDNHSLPKRGTSGVATGTAQNTPQPSRFRRLLNRFLGR